MFRPVDQQPDLPALEQAQLARWNANKIFEQTLDKTRDGKPFNLYEGPPTANGKPGVHHVESRVFKDIFPRYQTMKGRYVRRVGGWDCHGIPVEIAAEKDLGLTCKKDIEEYGVEAFTKHCRESVLSYVDDWKALTERVAYWADLDNSYWTMDTSFIESEWWSLQRIYNEGNLYESHRVVPYCGRCGTALSDHEVAQGYEETVDPSVYVRFPITSGKLAEEGAALAIWTTTPWTLVSNMMVQGGPDIAYVLVKPLDAPAPEPYTDKHGNLVTPPPPPPVNPTPLVMARDLVESVLGAHYEIVRDVPISELEGTRYEGPYTFYTPEDHHFRYVSMASYVTTSDGTGLVHSAPAFGAEDYDACKAEGVGMYNPVNAAGEFMADLPEAFAGKFVKDCDAYIMDDLAERGLLIKHVPYTHTYPFCWRCKRPLIYYATPSWYISTTSKRDTLLAYNDGVEWHPGHIKEGRYGEWLRNNIDWSLSRTRYWGTPLPIWRSDDHEEVVVVGSLQELGELAGKDLSELDPHRPYIDAITIPSKMGKGELHRVPDVIDAWYDSGAMPFAQFGYPWKDGSKEAVERFTPANYVCEAIDQTRGWFYSMMAESAMLFDHNTYDAVLCLGHIVDDKGKKMSKSQGNIIDPWEILDKHGADPLRWLMLCDGSPWVNRRVGHATVEDVTRRFILTLWNSYYFFVTYARIDEWTPPGTPGNDTTSIAVEDRPIMDQWLMSELQQLVATVDDRLGHFDATTAGRAIEDFVDSLSNWYIRRSRNRFWASDATSDKQAAFETLHEALSTVAILLAPFTPFLADELHSNLVQAVNPKAPASVHLEDFPKARVGEIHRELSEVMAHARSVVTLGLRARNDVKIGVRQPLPEILLGAGSRLSTWEDIAKVVKEELNVKEIRIATPDSETTVTYELKPDFRAIGSVYGKETPKIADAIRALDASEYVSVLRPVAAVSGLGSASMPDDTAGEASILDGPGVTIDVAGQPVKIVPAMVTIMEHSREGWQVASDGPTSVSLRTTLTPELRAEGLAREVIRAINDQRKAQAFNLDDRIRASITTSAQVHAALVTHAQHVQDECLIVEWTLVEAEVAEGTTVIDDLGVAIELAVVA